MQARLGIPRLSALPRAFARLPEVRPARSTLVLGLLVLITFGALATLAYQRRTAADDLAAARTQLAQVRKERLDVQATALRMESAEAGQAAAREALEAHGRQMVGSAERIALLEAIAGLSARTGVTLRSLTLSEGQASSDAARKPQSPAGPAGAAKTQPAKPAGKDDKQAEEGPYVPVTAALGISGSEASITEFIDAAQSGIVPGMVVAQVNMQKADQQVDANLSLAVHTWPTASQTFSLPRPLWSVGTPSGGDHTERIGAETGPLLIWELQGRPRTDHVRQVTLRSDALDGRARVFRLYADTSTLGPPLDTLLAEAAPRANGTVDLSPAGPFPFQADQGLRLYVTAEISSDAVQGSVFKVWMQAEDVVYTAMEWPSAAETPALRATVHVADIETDPAWMWYE